MVLLDRHDPVVERGVTAELVALHCTPAINLFPRRADRIHLTDRVHEYHLLADRTRPMDLEVHTVSEVVGFGNNAEAERTFAPFYSCTERSPHRPDAAFYTLHREPRLASSRQRRQGPRSTYTGSEMFISIVDGQQGPYHADLKQLSVQTLCTNRDLPLHMSVGEGSTDFHVESGAPVQSVRCVAGPTTPHESHAWGGTSWRLISHLSLNYLSITNSNEGEGAAALRELLQLYAHLADPAQARQIEGVRTIASVPIVRPLPVPGPGEFRARLGAHLAVRRDRLRGHQRIFDGDRARAVLLEVRLAQLLHRNRAAHRAARTNHALAHAPRPKAKRMSLPRRS